MIYFDNSATSFYKPQIVKDAIINALDNYTANAGRGGYLVANNTSMKIMETREVAKQLFGQSFECIFTPSCSHALNLAIMGSVKNGSHVLTTYLEHNSVLRVLEFLRKQGAITYTILTDFSTDNIKRNIKRNTTHIITTHISNVTGEKLDIDKISKIAKKHNLIYILDSAQGAGHVDDNFEECDMVAFAGHKGLKGLSGVGGLMVKSHIRLKPIVFGGTGSKSLELVQPTDYPEGFEVGSLGAVQIISLGAGIKHFLDNKQNIISKERELTEYFKQKLLGLKFIKTYFNPNNVHGVFAFNIDGLESSLVANMLDEKFNICVRSGFHCAPLVHKYHNTEKVGMIRASINDKNSKEEIDIFIDAIEEIYNTLKNET